jgi:hypothetical protein
MPRPVKRQRRRPVGSQWRILAYGAGGTGQINVQSEDYPTDPEDSAADRLCRLDHRTVFDELVILNPAGGPSIIHVEMMSEREYFVGIGDDKLMVRVDRNGKVRRSEWYR